ncbi:unnamed protein product, partial [Rotaria socialis]
VIAITAEALSETHDADSPVVCKAARGFKSSKSSSSSCADAQHR